MRNALLLAALLFGCSTSDSGDDSRVDTPDAGVQAPSIEISPFLRATCARGTSGVLKCWGGGESGALGTGAVANIGDKPDQMGDMLPALDLGAGRTVLQADGGNEAACALLDDHRVKCWGGNQHGNLGLGYEMQDDMLVNLGDAPGEMGDALPYVDLGADVTVKQLSVGLFHACVITSDDRVKCWGDNTAIGIADDTHGHRGDDPDEMGDNLPYIDLGAHTAKAIAALDTRTCAILENDKLRCWGYNVGGVLGLGNTDTYGGDAAHGGDNIPDVDLGTGRTVLQVVGGQSHTCALLDDHSVKCWGGGQGWSNVGNIGAGDKEVRGDGPDEMGDNLKPIDLGTGRTALQIAAGVDHTCALLDDHTVKCWGQAYYGELGYQDPWTRGDAPNEMGDFLPTVNLGPDRTALSIAAGGLRTCVYLDDNSVKCWGHGANGQLGLGNEVSHGDAPYSMGARLPVVQLGGW